MKIDYPKTYLVWDLETTGLEKENCKILEIGYTRVINGETKESQSFVLNHGIPVPEKIVEITGITDEIVAKEGMDPEKAIRAFLEVLYPFLSEAHVTHNGFRFDIEWLAYHVAKTLKWSVADHTRFLEQLRKTAIDTAAFVKGERLGIHRKWDESFRTYAERVMQIMAPGKYNLSIACDDRGIDRTKVTQHRSLGDVYLTNELYKAITQQ